MNYIRMIMKERIENKNITTKFVYKECEEQTLIDKNTFVPIYIMFETIFFFFFKLARSMFDNKYGSYIANVKQIKFNQYAAVNQMIEIMAQMKYYNDKLGCYTFEVSVNSENGLIVERGEIMMKKTTEIDVSQLSDLDYNKGRKKSNEIIID